MRRFLAARHLARCCFMLVLLSKAARAQTWNDPRSRALVEQATARRAEQLADTGLVDYQATARGYVTFLAQLGEGFPAPPKIIKADQLALEVYWHAPGLSKQRIIGRRDTLLLPTDIQYHRDHLGIVQNNFPSIIRVGEGDEVADVPHPLSAVGLREYDFAVADSFTVGAAGSRVQVYEVKVRPRDDRKPRVVGAVYLDKSGGQVVRMAFNFTHAAFLDNQLEDLAIVLENRLVGGRFWLPSRQEVEIRRSGTWLDYPVRGIIRGRWEIADYQFNISIPTETFSGPEIVQAPPQELKRYPWTGAVLDSLPPDVRAVADPSIQRVQDEARALVHAQALSRVQTVAVSVSGVSDFARFNRVEGLALGEGVRRNFGRGVSTIARGRYGIDDREVKGELTFLWQHPSGFSLRIFGMRDFRDAGDEPERSTVLNSIAAQEFASDYTDPYFARGAGMSFELPAMRTIKLRLAGSYERHDSLAVHAGSIWGHFQPTLGVPGESYTRLSLQADRQPGLWFWGTELEAHAEFRALLNSGNVVSGFGPVDKSIRISLSADIERPFGSQRLVLRTIGASVLNGAFGENGGPPEQSVYFGGPITAPGYDYHSLYALAGLSQRAEWRFQIPFFPLSLGRFGRVNSRATLAPFATAAYLGGSGCIAGAAQTLSRGGCSGRSSGVFPSIGVGFLTPFDLIRVDVARGLRGSNGHWIFSIDVSREFWKIL